MLFFIVCACFALFPAQVLWGAQSGLALCLNAVIPSLLPFMFVSSCIIKSGFSKPLGIIFSKVLTPLTGISPIGCVCFITGILGGYGAGAKAVLECFREGQITKEEAEKLLPICNNAGPLFVIGTIGISFFGDRAVGVNLFLVQALSILICACLFGGSFSNREETFSKGLDEYKKNKPSLGKLVTSAAVQSGSAIITACVFVITFSAVLEIFPLGRYSFLCGIAEVTRGCSELSRFGYDALPLISAFVAWGGLSVHFQADALTEGSFSMKNYYIVKLAVSLIAFVITKICFNDLSLIFFASTGVLALMLIKNFVSKYARQHGFRQQRHS